jgi:hypothetical protein
MDQQQSTDIRLRRQRRQAVRAISDRAESDLAMHLLIAALVLVLCGVVAASSLVQLGGFRSADAADPTACVRLADDASGQCATRPQVADRLLALHRDR